MLCGGTVGAECRDCGCWVEGLWVLSVGTVGVVWWDCGC